MRIHTCPRCRQAPVAVNSVCVACDTLLTRRASADAKVSVGLGATCTDCTTAIYDHNDVNPARTIGNTAVQHRATSAWLCRGCASFRVATAIFG